MNIEQLKNKTAKRLTEYKTTEGMTEIIVKPKVQRFMIVYKLCLLEDIMEKYNIKTVEELDNKLANGVTWQKACELACGREDDCYVYDNIHKAYEFYQQAKTERNE